MMTMRSKTLGTLVALTLATGFAALAGAQEKSVVVEAAPAFPAFSQWAETFVVALPAVPLPSIQVVPFAAPATQPSNYEARPVIVGAPELPLLGAGSRQAARDWRHGFNYQGAHVSLIVADTYGQRTLKPVAYKLRVGERFKIRVTSTFDGVADIDQLVGSDWQLQRVGQAYPAPGSSVEVKAGKSVELPLGETNYFVFDGRPQGERAVLSLRHAKALGEAASVQPVYRQEGRTGSNFLQLVPSGKYPIIEQQINSTR